MSIKEILAEKLLNSGTDVKNNVLDVLYNTELKTRTDACLKLLSKIEEQQKELKKLRVSNNNIYNEDGTVQSGGFTKERIGEINNAKANLEKLEKALESALERNDFTKALELGK